MNKVNNRWFEPGDNINFTGTFCNAALVISSSGKEGNPVVFQQWEGREFWKIDGMGVIEKCIDTNGKRHVVIKGGEVFEAKNVGIFVQGTSKPTFVELYALKSHDNGRHGFLCAGFSSKMQLTGVTLKKCEAYNNGGTGFHRRFVSREEVISNLEEYLKQLQAEAKGVEEHLAKLKKEVLRNI